MKKILSLLIACLMIFALAGCGDFKPPSNDEPGTDTPVQPGGPENPSDPSDPDDEIDEDSFSATLVYRDLSGKYVHYMPDADETLRVIWTNKESGGGVYPTVVNANGVAVRDDLDGDYSVTLETPPVGFTYDPNIYDATNDNKHLEIVLYAITYDYGMAVSTDRYDYHRLASTGTFRVTLQNSRQTVFFRFETSYTGLYTVQSIADVTENKINPILDIYIAASQYIFETPTETRDGGGKAENTFTKNFYWESNVDRGWNLTFGLRSECIDEDAYPINIDFILDRDGELTSTEEIVFRKVEVTYGDRYNDGNGLPDDPVGIHFTSPKHITTLTDGSLLDQSLVGLNEDDGFYHLLDANGEPNGSLLYAVLTKDTPVVGTLDDGATGDGVGLSDPRISKRLMNGSNDADPCDYSDFFNQYAAVCNQDGAYPVTEELKEYLMKHSVCQQLFKDGKGFAEAFYKSSHSNQWLFNCFYYEGE